MSRPSYRELVLKYLSGNKVVDSHEICSDWDSMAARSMFVDSW